MNAQYFRDLLQTRPFVPFEVNTSGGQTHRVSHPETAMVTPTRLVVCEPDDRLIVLSLLHVTGVKLLEPAG